VLVGLRNLFRDANEPGSVYDELLVVRPPKRVIGGFLVRFLCRRRQAHAAAEPTTPRGRLPAGFPNDFTRSIMLEQASGHLENAVSAQRVMT
jgi:hypothetical protein